MSGRTIMVVDDEREILEMFREVIESKGYDVITCDDSRSAIDTLKVRNVYAAFVDVRMPDIGGVEVLKHIKETQPETEVVMITSYTQNESIEQALKLGCFVCMMKPLKPRDILGVLEVLEAGLDDEMPMAA